MAKIEVEIPDRLVDAFLGYMSDGGGEYQFMESYHNIDEKIPGTFLGFTYSWKEQTIKINIIKDNGEVVE